MAGTLPATDARAGEGGMSEEASRHNPHRGLRPEMEEPVSRLTGFHVRLLAPLDDVY